MPWDGSETSRKALNVAIGLAKRCESEKLALVHVYSIETPFKLSNGYLGDHEHHRRFYQVRPAAPTHLSNFQTDFYQESIQLLARAARIVQAERLSVETILRKGHTGEEIIKAADEGDFDLIVIGARGVSKIKEVFLGSISYEVIRHANCPVLTVK